MSKCLNLCLSTLLLPAMLQAAVFHVGPRGDDQADGLTPASAFATLQRGVDALNPGDTLLIAPGEYYESVLRKGLGHADFTTVIRAAIPGTAVLRGDRPAPEFRRLEGYRFVYVADVDYATPVQVVNERDTPMVLQGRPSIAELEFNPGTFYHDLEAGKLYLATSDARPPAMHDCTVTLLTGDGLRLEEAVRVEIEGIGATGFNIAQFGPGGAGISLVDSRHSTIRNCAAWLNGFGIEINSRGEGSGGNLMEHCLAWGNSSHFANFRRGGLTAVSHRSDIIRDSEAYHNTSTGIYLRGGADDTARSRLVDNLSWGNRYGLLIKGNPDHSLHAMERCIGPSYSTRENASDGLYWKRKHFDTQDAPNTIVLTEEEGLVMEDEFADPLNRDYRLQAASRFRGAGEGGIDRGPLPYQANIYYIAPDGNDQNDGLSAAQAWRTPTQALARLQPGETLYFAPGTYEEALELTLAGTPDKPIVLRGRGRGAVSLTGPVNLTESANLILERLQFTSSMTINGGSHITIQQCRLAAPAPALSASGARALTLRHNEFAAEDAPAIVLDNVQDILFAGNLVKARSAPALRAHDGSVLFADYNAYGIDPRSAWSLPDDTLELHSFILPPKPDHHPRLQTGGPLGKPFGPFDLDPLEEKLRLIDGPHLHSAGATTANIEWLANMPCQVELAWGATPAMENRESVESDFFGTFSLTGLEPGRTYYCRILQLNPSTRIYGQHEPKRLAEPIPSAPDIEPLTFTTAATDRPAGTWHVRPDGSNSNSGLSPADAFQTIQQAANVALPGDTVLIGGGEYVEQVRIRATGAPDRPILFRSAPGETVVLAAGPAELNDAFAISNKHHLHIDGLYLLSMWINLYRSDHVRISRIFAGRYGRAYAPGFINARLCDSLQVDNSVALSAKSGPKFAGCRNLVIRNCVFYRNMISQMTIDNLPGDPTLITDNIFTDGLVGKSRAGMISLARYIGFSETNNCYFPRWERWDAKPIIMLYSDIAFERARLGHNLGEVTVDHPVVEEIERLNFEQTRALLGDNGSILADPAFAGLVEFPQQDEDGQPLYNVDRMTRPGVIPFHNFFATNPLVIQRGMGLQQDQFDDLE